MTTTRVPRPKRAIGYATVRRPSQAGHLVHLGAPNRARGEQAATAIAAKAVGLAAATEASGHAAAEQVRDAVGHLDVLINNASARMLRATEGTS